PSRLALRVLHRSHRSALVPYTTLFRSVCGTASLPPREHVATAGGWIASGIAGISLVVCLRGIDRVEQFAAQARESPRFDNASRLDRKSTRLNSSHVKNSYAVFCLKKKR